MRDKRSSTNAFNASAVFEVVGKLSSGWLRYVRLIIRGGHETLDDLFEYF